MDNKELSYEFDILYNNISSNQAPGLTEYEKSVFLTSAQENFIIELYSGRNGAGLSFERTEESRAYLDSLLKVTKEEKVAPEDYNITNEEITEENSDFYLVPEDAWFIIYEGVEFKPESTICSKDSISVVPITHDEYHKIKNNPFRKFNDRRVLRLEHGTVDIDSRSTRLVELIYTDSIRDAISKYVIKYIAKPDPIVLEDLSDGLTINGFSTKKECTLNPAVHRTILIKAVQLAAMSWNRGLENKQQ